MQKSNAIKGYNTLTPIGSQSNVRAYVLLGDTPTLSSDSSYEVDMKRILDPAQNPHVYQFYNKIKGDQIEDGAITLSKLANESVNSSKILDGSVTDEKTNFFKLGVNLLNPSRVHDKAYYSDSYYSNDNYCASDYIAIEPETMYYWKNFSNDSTSARFLYCTVILSKIMFSAVKASLSMYTSKK